MPLARAFAEAGKRVVLVDVDADVVEGINRGSSHIRDVPSEVLGQLVADGRVSATTDYDALRDAEAILIALPTPLSSQREPDLSIVRRAAEDIATRLGRGSWSCWSRRRTRDDAGCLQPILEQSGLKAGEDFHLAFSPERVDPGRTDWTTRNTPKLVGVSLRRALREPPISTRGPWRHLTPCRRRRRRRCRSCWRTSSARSTSRS